jgi:heat shock protein HslJ
MKGKLFPAIGLLLFFAACTASRKAANEADRLSGRWVLSVFRPDQKKTLAEIFGTRVIELQFNATNDAVNGTTGCNRFTGRYSADTVNLHFSPNLALTKKACPGYDEQLFLKALHQVNRYRLMESELELRENNAIVMIFAKRPE